MENHTKNTEIQIDTSCSGISEYIFYLDIDYYITTTCVYSVGILLQKNWSAETVCHDMYAIFSHFQKAIQHKGYKYLPNILQHAAGY
jgi:hypothetical protein